ncbi:MAG: Sec-independent protein translocase protein TatB [Pseudomonadota bacterium]
MFDIGWAELLIIGLVALIVVGPKDLPIMFRKIGQWVGRMRNMARDFQRAMDDAADQAGVTEIKKGLKDATNMQDKIFGDAADSLKNFQKEVEDDKAANKADVEAAKAARKKQVEAANAAAEKWEHSPPVEDAPEAAEAPVSQKKPTAKKAAAKKPAAKTSAKAKAAPQKTAAKKPAPKKAAS